MFSAILSYIFCFLGILGALAIVGGWGVYKFRNHFIREVFMVCCMIAFFCFAILSMGIICTPNEFVEAFPFLKWNSFLPEGTTSGLLFLTFIWIIVVNAMGNIYPKWEGKKSVLQHEEEIGERKPDTRAMLKALFYRDPVIRTWTGFEEEKITPLIPSSLHKKKNWSIHAAEILMLLDSQYKIHLGLDKENNKNDWYEAEQCFIGTYGKTDITVGILCREEEPTLGELERFAQFVQEQTPINQSFKLLAVIANEDNQEEITVNLVGPITFRYEGELIRSLLLHFEKYRQKIIQRYESNRIDLNSPITLQNIYVSPSGRQFKRTSQKDEAILEQPISNIETYLNNWLTEDTNTDKRQIALLGEYGQGKSVMSLRLAYTILKNKATPQRLPIIIELRGASPRSFRNQLEFLSVWAVNYDVLPKIVYKLHELGKLVLIFEGFDEMDLVGNYEVRLNHFQKIWSFSTPNSKILITGRPNFFLNDRELTTLLRTHQGIPELPYCEEVHLDMFTLPQVEQALRYKPPKVRSEIVALLRSSPEGSGFRDLMKRPALLFIAGVIWEKEQLNKKGTHINSAYVMERFLAYSYKRQQDKLLQQSNNRFGDNKPILEIAERSYFMMGIAIAMTKYQGYTNQVKLVDLNEATIKLINGFNSLITQKAPQRFYQTSFEERVQGLDAKKAVLRDVIACGVLVRDYSGEDLFKFAHKSFLEYLIGRFYVSFLLGEATDNQYIIAKSIADAFKIDLLDVHHTADTAKFTGELLANDAGIHSDDYAENAKKIFRFLYPVRILDRFPQIAFPSMKAFGWGMLFGGIGFTFAAVLATLVHPYVGLAAEIVMAITLFLFGLRLRFRLGEIFGMLFIGHALIYLLEEMIELPFSRNYIQLLELMGNGETTNSGSFEEFIPIIVMIGLALLIVKFFLIKSTSKNTWSLVAFENQQIDKLLQLWVIACEGIGVPDSHLLKFMSKRKLKKLKEMTK